MARTKIHPTFSIANRALFKKEYFEEIGVLIIQGNFLESFIREAIISLIGTESEEGDIAISGMNLRTMLRVLRALVYHKLPDQWRTYDRLSKSLERAVDMRNGVAHSVVTPVGGSRDEIISYKNMVRARKGRLDIDRIERLTAHQIRRRALFVHRTFIALADFLEDNDISRPCS